jgi:hypothetical protein
MVFYDWVLLDEFGRLKIDLQKTQKSVSLLRSNTVFFGNNTVKKQWYFFVTSGYSSKEKSVFECACLLYVYVDLYFFGLQLPLILSLFTPFSPQTVPCSPRLSLKDTEMLNLWSNRKKNHAN